MQLSALLHVLKQRKGDATGSATRKRSAHRKGHQSRHFFSSHTLKKSRLFFSYKYQLANNLETYFAVLLVNLKK